MPIARPDTARTARGVPIVIAVVANDEGGNLMISGYTQPTAGTLALNPDRTFTYTPGPAFEGIDGFAYTIRDGVGGTAEGDVRIFVARPNTVPEAANDAATVELGASVAIPVLANDGDADGDPLAIIGLDAPAHGTITVLPDQSIRYAPQADFAGIDSFTYTVGDGQGGTAEASVTITVTVPNRPPVAQPDRATTVAGSPVTIDALANDNDPEGNPVALAGMEMPGQGSLALTADNRFVYTPRPGFVGEDSFSYTIRDSAGATARGDVTVTVTPRNAPPTAVPDNLTSDGAAVTFDPLANDSDADGDPLQLKSLTMPLSGRVALGADGRVTYIPPTGFTGADGFTYQVGDGRAVSEAEVSISVTAPALPTYANGYRYRRRIVVPPQTTAAETATDFVLLVQESGGWLKSAVAGGRIEHAQGFDLRFELENGTKLDHEVERYGAGNGTLISWVRIPSWSIRTQLRLYLYYGKPDLTNTEANPAGTWRGYLAVLDARTGTDRSGANRGLTPTNIASGLLIGDAGVYAGTSVASRTDASFLSGLGALTVQALTIPDGAMVGSNSGFLAQGPMSGGDAAAGLTMQYLAQSADGTTNVVHFKLNCADGAAFAVSGAKAQRAERQLLHGTWAQGAAPRLFMDGAELDPSSSAARSGLTALPAGGLYLGAGARNSAAGGWRGVLDEVRLAAVAFTPARIAAEAANLAAIQALYGIGDEDAAGQSDAAPVAVPLRASVTSGSSVDIDVAASVYDPDGPSPATVSAVGIPASGVVTVVAGKVRYTPFAGFVGADRFTYTIQSAGKQSASIIQVTVAAAVDTRPKHPAAAQRVLKVPEDYATIALAYAAAAAGDHISLANGTYAETLKLNRTFPGANPVVIRARSTVGAVPGATIGGQITVSGRGHWLHELRTGFAGSTRNNADVEISSNYVFVTRCWMTGREGVAVNATAHHVWVGWNRFTGRNSPTGTDGSGNPTTLNCFQFKINVPGSFPSQTSGPYEIYCYRNFFWDDTNHRLYSSNDGGESMCCYIGNDHPGPADLGTLLNVAFEENYLPAAANGHSRPRSIYAKRGCGIIRNRSTHAYGVFGQRHGWGSKIYGNRVTDPDVVVIGDERAGSYATGQDIRNNVVAGTMKLYRASETPSGAPYQAADWTTLFQNQGKLTVGYLPSNNNVVADDGGIVDHVRIYAHTGTVTINAAHVDAASITQSTGNPLGLSEGAALIPATFDGRDTGFESGDQGLS